MTDQIPAAPSTPPPANPYGAAPVQAATPSVAKSVGGAILKRIIGFVLVAVVASVGWFIYRTVTGDVSTAKVGDCITETVEADASDAKVVDCGDAKAANKVVGIEEGMSRSAATIGASTGATCKGFPTATNFIWVGENTSSGDVWCLEPLSK